MPLTYSGFFIGTGPIIDPTEGNDTAENAAALVGQTYGGVQQALAANIVTITAVNTGGTATALDQNNNNANDQVIVNDGSGPVTYIFDAAALYRATLTYIDGTTATVDAIVFQTTTGELFLAPGQAAGGAWNTALTAGALRSITFSSVLGATYAGLALDRAALSFPTCFARGTRIATPDGPRPVERLLPGDAVLTLDRGAQPLAWVGSRRVGAAEMMLNPALRPVVIRAGSLGRGLPHGDLVLSQQHRVLVASRIAARLAGQSEVLVPARHLLGLPGVDLARVCGGVDYWHILFDRHEIVLSEGARTESLLPGPQAMQSLSPAARSEIKALFPDLPWLPARHLPPGKIARDIAGRHARNDRPLQVT